MNTGVNRQAGRPIGLVGRRQTNPEYMEVFELYTGKLPANKVKGKTTAVESKAARNIDSS